MLDCLSKIKTAPFRKEEKEEKSKQSCRQCRQSVGNKKELRSAYLGNEMKFLQSRELSGKYFVNKKMRKRKLLCIWTSRGLNAG